MKPQMNTDGRRYILIKDTHTTLGIDADFHRFELINVN
jgi:hypothetical protein